MNDKKITATQPSLPPLNEFIPNLKKIWENKWLTNNGSMHVQLEFELSEYLGVKYLSLFSNGKLVLIAALHALNLKGEVITTPFSFVASTHSIWWNKLNPVFVDIEPEYLTLDPKRIAEAITPLTSSILPVHVFGNICKIDEIQKIADKYKLKVIYDAAHAFNVKKGGISVLNYGDLSILSFHATKVFSTIGGGAVICNSSEMKYRLDNIKNFGIISETEVFETGINAKLNEIQSAFGLLQLKYIDGYFSRRKTITELYRRLLKGVRGIRLLPEMDEVTINYTYFLVFVDEVIYGISRDALYNRLKVNNIFTRRYFYPLISIFTPYCGLPSAQPKNLSVARK